MPTAWESYTYLGLHLFSISFPLVRSFEPRVNYSSRWGKLFPAIVITAIFFIVWDIVFTAMGIWSFNDQYLIGLRLAGLPIEEWMFFFTIPFACVFIYDCILYFFPRLPDTQFLKASTLIFALLMILVAVFNYDKTYTFYKVGLAGVALLLFLYYFKGKHLAHFWLTYAFHLIPFMLVNGVLTSLPVVLYNDTENLGIRIGQLINIPFFNIPIEDSQYSLLLLLMNIAFYEVFKAKGQTKVAQNQFEQLTTQ